ncbi:TolC family protein [Kangiella koreensis]|uniref:Outer membrane efflux protein n=1 Tax=Kangiella koreensis (strain DSM 16069 / JCM 12317 / KCTC 12182 / SW-125) TaxID=523791 RepID=C7RCM7_KANKD|nr:TolC family protein [Kangiella koreensis]ACV27019.1 outer membrane efflux protein [Kangiella koreensis DSM 16069]
MFNLFISRNLSLKFIAVAMAFCATFVSMPAQASSEQSPQKLTLEQAISLAQQNDPWLQSNQYRQQAVEAKSISANTYADPMISISAANLPVDSFDFSQEAMTQLKVGVTQALPRGDSLALAQKRLQQLGQEFPLQRQDRKAKVKATVTQLWLDVYLIEQTINLIERDRQLFEQLAETVSLNYSSGMRQTRQQDVIRSQVELTRLDDRLSKLHQELAIKKSMLKEWLINDSHLSFAHNNFSLPAIAPKVKLEHEQVISLDSSGDKQMLIQHLQQHPQVLAFEQKVKASQTTIDLAKQKYKPQWNLNASYGHRDDDPMGNNRSDLFSVGVSFDLPIFTSNRQDQEVTASVKEREAIKTDKWLLLRSLLSATINYHGQLNELNKRHSLYKESLLKEMNQQAEATLNAYTNDNGDFTEVMRSRIDELNTKIDALNVEINYLKTIAQLNYLLTQANTPG